ncbi:g13324 [Coccomyxa viridis]|uniref:G13324 protein n=1 Tax=Coccomyxa viridis TaxID=1274662 RepID=A0ABP1GCK0_9CHLO
MQNPVRDNEPPAPASEDLDEAEDDSLPQDLSLGELDFTSQDISLKGVDDELDRYAGHEVLRAILDQGCDPKEYGRHYEARLRQAELESIQDYLSESDNLVTLHQQISSCDAILATMEDMLGKFQSDLGNISNEIRALQEQSQSMSVRLRNRKAAESRLGTFLDNLALPPSLIDGVLLAPPDAGFAEHLLALHKKLEFAKSSEMASTSAAMQDIAPELERLRAKAVSKSRDILMNRIYQLRKTKTNIQILQQNVLLKQKYMVTFLRQHGPEVFHEMRSAYVETLSRVLSSHFRSYLAALERLQEDLAGPADVIGEAAPGGMGGVMANLFQRGASGAHRDAFALGERGNILHHLDQAAIIPHVAEAESKKAPFEVLFRSVNKLLMDTATAEYLFCCDFFQEDTIFSELFTTTLAVVESSLAASIQECYDLVALLLMIRMNYHHQLIMNKRRIPCLDDYLDRVNLLLWPRFKVMLDMQLQSMRAYNPANFGQDPGLHFITQRYALLTTSLLLLNADYQDGQMDHNIDRLRYAALELLIRLSKRFGRKRTSTIFLVNNLHHIVQLLREAASRGGQMAHAPGTSPPPPTAPLGASGAETIKEFEDQLTAAMNVYVEEALGLHVGELVRFVRAAEAAAKQQNVPEGLPVPGYGPPEAAPIMKDFASRWTSAIEALNKETMKDFRSSACGREVLKAAMTQLLLYYTRMLELLKRAGPEGAALMRDAPTVPSMMFETRKQFRV